LVSFPIPPTKHKHNPSLSKTPFSQTSSEKCARKDVEEEPEYKSVKTSPILVNPAGKNFSVGSVVLNKTRASIKVTVVLLTRAMYGTSTSLGTLELRNNVKPSMDTNALNEEARRNESSVKGTTSETGKITFPLCSEARHLKA